MRAVLAGVLCCATLLCACRAPVEDGDDLQAARTAMAERQWSRAERLLGRLGHDRRPASLFAQRAVTFALVCAAWVFFRAGSVSDALTIFSRLFTGWMLPALHTTALTLGAQPAAQLVLGALCLHLLPEDSSDTPTPRGVLAFCLLTLAAATAWFAALHAGTANAFIYFQF